MTTEKRLINANVVLAKKFTAGLSDASGNYYGYADVVFADDIENAPTTDAVEVVRCKDCKRRIEKRWCYSLHTYNGEPVGVADDFFCAYGKRKSDG